MRTDSIELTIASIPSDSGLAYENYQVLCAIQALYGAISQNILAVRLECLGADVHLHFYLAQESDDDREEIGDLVGEMEALQVTNVLVVTHVHVVSGASDSVGSQGRPVYRRKL